MPKLSIDVAADVVCPWCFIGSRRLSEALATLGPDIEVEVRHRPFLLDPTAGREGGDLRERLRSKYGGDPDQMFHRVESVAKDAGIPLDFSKVRRWVWTGGAHTLLRHAEAKGTQAALLKALYSAYFLEGQDIGQEAELVALAQQHGFTRDEAERLLRDEAELAKTGEETTALSAAGVQGVPFFIFNGRYAVSGAQPTEVFLKVIAKTLEAGA